MTTPPHVLVVDDQAENRLILDELLTPDYVVHTTVDGMDALSYLNEGGRADVIVTDIAMPRMDGFEFCRRLKTDLGMRDVPVLFLSAIDGSAAEEKALAIGAEDFIHKPFSHYSVLARIATHLKLARTTRQLREQNATLGSLVDERTDEIRRQAEAMASQERRLIGAQSATITAFCSLAEARDNETGNHIRRTQHYVRALAARLKAHPRFAAELSDNNIDLIFRSAPLHDIGKIAVPDSILLKPGPLTPDEWTVMKRHCEYGRDAIAVADAELGEEASFLRFARQIAHSHHERWDGTGYPQGLAGETIPLAARFMAVADVYDALTTVRVYKPAYPHEQAITMIAAGRGEHFDPDIADALAALDAEFREIAAAFRDDESLHGRCS